VQFYIFKSSIKVSQHPVNFIYSQIEDFLSQKDIRLSGIKVIRTINSLTLQHDSESKEKVETKQFSVAELKEENVTIDDFMITEEETSSIAYEVQTEPLNCKECGAIELNEMDLEIHEFLKHSSFGNQLEAEVSNCKMFVEKKNHPEIIQTFYVCSICTSQINNSDIMLLHFLEDHCIEMIDHVNGW
jgi:hypothetical protein